MTKAPEYKVSLKLKIQSVCVAMCSLVMSLSSCDFLRHQQVSLTELNSCKIFRNHNTIRFEMVSAYPSDSSKTNCTLYHF